jgi:NAD dependent epimerase/dehydratase family enzyme
LLKSRRVVPGRLRTAGFMFAYPEWDKAVADLVDRVRSARSVRQPGRD